MAYLGLQSPLVDKYGEQGYADQDMSSEKRRRKNRTIPEQTEHLSKAALFVAVARAGAFSKAAASLGIGRSTLSEHIRTLEESLGVRLLERSTRQLRLTDEGEVLLERMEVMLEAWGEALLMFEGRRVEPAGHLRVTCPMGIDASLVAPVLTKMLSQYPALRGEVLVDDRIYNLVDDGIDIAVRMAPLDDSSMIAKLLGQTPLRVVGAPALVDALGDELGTLERAEWVGHSAVKAPEIFIKKPKSERVAIRPNYRAFASTGPGQIALLAGGVGLALMPWLLVAADVQAGRLATVGDWVGGPLGIYAIYPAKRLLSPRTRRFLDLLVAEIPVIGGEAGIHQR